MPAAPLLVEETIQEGESLIGPTIAIALNNLHIALNHMLHIKSHYEALQSEFIANIDACKTHFLCLLNDETTRVCRSNPACVASSYNLYNCSQRYLKHKKEIVKSLSYLLYLLFA